jgi:LPPG:FO 2-phospho-L-lactate transferase
VIALLAGGTGAAKFLRGLIEIVPQEEITIIGNTGDDCTVWGLHVAPDLDTIMYLLAGLLDEARGWGVKNDTFTCLATIGLYEEPTWFKLGDRDLATHIERTKLLRDGFSLTQVTARLCRMLDVRTRLLPMSNEHVETRIHTPSGVLTFQEFFVRENWQPEVTAVEFSGGEQARPAPGVIEAIMEADCVIIAPSNPITSIGPILSISGIRQALTETKAPVVAVSPIIGGQAVSGPAAKLMKAGGSEPTVVGVANTYAGLIDWLLIAEEDARLIEEVGRLSIGVCTAPLLMTDQAAKVQLARAALACLHS